MLKSLNRKSSKLIFKNNYWEYKLDEYEQPNGEIGEYHYINSRGSSFAIPKLTGNNYILTRQFRYLNQRISIEFPGGGVKEGASPLSTAREELLEETGYEAKKWVHIGEANPFNGVTNELCNVYLAEELTLNVAKPEETEEFEIISLSDKEIIELIKQGEIWDGMTITAWALYWFSR